MPDINQDFLSLQYSQSFAIDGMQEADIGLILPPAGDSSATVYGVVTDGTNPIANATVKLFDSQGLPYKHTLTNDAGEYFMDGVPAGTYTLGAVKDGYLLSSALSVTLANSDTTEMNLVCIADVTLNLGTIAGVLTTEGASAGTRVPLAGAKITLKDATDNTVAYTYTAQDGEFVFYDVADGRYTLMSTAEGYLASAPVTVVITNGSIANISMTMLVDSRTYSGTVSGIIRDNTGRIVAGCFVGLYQLTKGTDGTVTETLVATTKTNAEGKYLFGGVDGGEYLVKAKMSL